MSHSKNVILCAQAEVFEEIATMDHPFEGIPTVPPRKDVDHLVGSGFGGFNSNQEENCGPRTVRMDLACKAACRGNIVNAREVEAGTADLLLCHGATKLLLLCWCTCCLQTFFCSGCRYRVTAKPDWSVEKVSKITS